MSDSKDRGSPQHSRKNSQVDGSPQKVNPAAKHSRQFGSADIKLADLMDEDEAKWMSTMESSRSPTPNQTSTHGSILAKTNSRSATPPIHELYSHSRNATPPLPPLREERDSAMVNHKQLHKSVQSTEGLTALPRRAEIVPAHTFAQQVFLGAKDDLLYNYIERHRMPWHFVTLRHGAIDLTTLQKMQKYVIQQKLVAQVRAMGEREAWMEVSIGETLNQYCQALQNLEYMAQHAHRGASNDPFLISTRRPLEARLLEEAGLARQHPGTRSSLSTYVPKIRHIDRGSPCLKLLGRIALMLIVAIAVILPFLVAVFLPGYLPRVIVTCACTALFALVAAAVSTSRRLRILSIVLLLLYAGTLTIIAGTMPLEPKLVDSIE